ncbi:MAG: 6-phosphogluconolactonase, partial [Methylobacteriaceae bacterium]|nr:6-phosphogluconolactonase [Methylobacteriaceae bacterium]
RLAASRGSVAVALSGGSTPRALYAELALEPLRSAVPWERVHWFWGDERFVPADHPDSNARMARAAFLDHVPAPPENIHPVPTDGASPAEAAGRYAAELARVYGADRLDPGRPLFEIVLLGLGRDGHTASLFPGSPALAERERWAAAATSPDGLARITLTYPALESARAVAFLVAGPDKADILRGVLSGDSDAPAARLRPAGSLTWFVDEAALGGRAGGAGP